jgi:aerobic-type carbon monoxide dehydrogenase small subunit (CoxS/CutS family)
MKLQDTIKIQLTVNKKEIQKDVSTKLRLLDFIRDELQLTGTKEVCGEGECGACSIIMNGNIVNSCLIFAVEANGSTITTIEGISTDGNLSKIQQSFLDNNSIQCGFCIPGMIIAGEEIKKDNSNPTRDEIKDSLAGNICRCTGYTKIIDAIEE